MTRWLRVLISPEALLAVAIVYLSILATLTIVRVWFPETTMDLALIFLAGAATCFGIYRVWGFHPALRPSYHEWLASSPWTARKLLPLGPVHLVPQDVAIVAAAVLLAWPVHRAQALGIVPAFIFAYLVTMFVALLRSQDRAAFYAVGFGIGGMVQLISMPAYFAVVALATYIVAYIAYRLSLRRFPWEGATGYAQWYWERRRRQLGWPFRSLGPKFLDYRAGLDHFPQPHAFFTSFLVGWLYYSVIYTIFAAGSGTNPDVFFFMGLIGIPFGRLLVYLSGQTCTYVPPIDLWARLRTGRWIIPGYDQIFVAPLLAFLLGWALPSALGKLGLNETAGHAIAVGCMLFICLAAGPALKTWRLTGDHRLSAGHIEDTEHVAVG